MKILRIIASADPAEGGPIEGVLRTGVELARNGHEQHILTMDAPDAPFLADCPGEVIAMGRPTHEVNSGSALIRAMEKRVRFSPYAIPWLKVHRDEYGVAIVEGLWNFSTTAARWGLVGGNTPYLVFTHGMLDPWFKQNYPIKSMAKQMSWLLNEGPLLANAAKVLFTTEEEKLLARDAFWPYRVREKVVGYGAVNPPADNIDGQIAAFRAAVPELGDRSFLLYLSRIHEKKGCDLLIEAFAEYAARHPDVDLVIAGPDQAGLKASLQALAKRLGVASRIHWPGMLTGNAKWGAYRAARAFTLPSHQENFGIVVAEALACALPVLISNKVNIWREVADKRAGFVAPDTLDGARELLQRLSALSGDERADMGRRARACFERHFDIRNAAMALEAAAKEACGQ